MFMEKKEIKRIAAVTGLTGAALYVVCAALWLIAPELTAGIFGLLVHGLTLDPKVTLGLLEFIGGLAVSFVSGAAVGGLFAYFYGKVEL